MSVALVEPGHGPAVSLPPGGVAWADGLALAASDGVALRAALWNPGGARGLALYLPGRTEFLEKASMTAAALAKRGFAVASIDWRGQGLSARALDEPLKGHVESFEAYGRDLAALLAAPAVAGQGPVRLVLGHSMGTAIALGAVARGQIAPAALVLSAPMAGIAFKPAQNLGVKLVARLACALGLGNRWPPTEAAAKPNIFEPFEGNCLTHDPDIYAWQGAAFRSLPALQLGLPTFGWIHAAYEAMALMARLGPPGFPVQVLLGEKEGVVDNAASRRMAAKLGASLVEIEGARHDILMEDAPRRARVWQAIDGFLAEAGV
ncbi:MAG: alpha/beta hydrolase [Pseudomonadota bacterium]